MPKFDISWNAFGVLEGIEADDVDDAKEYLNDELFGINRDGLDYSIVQVSD